MVEGDAGLRPAEAGFTVAVKVVGFECKRVRRRMRQLQLDGVEIVGAESIHENVADLFEIAGGLQLFHGATNGEIVYENLRLIESALGDACQFAELEIAKVLNSHPDAGTEHREHEP